MPSSTGIWNIEEALEYHDFSYKLAKFIGDYLPKNKRINDWGCGKGTYLRYLHDRGFEDLHGVEGEYLPFSEFGNISKMDLTKEINGLKIGNSICLEVGEHIPKEYEATFMDNLARNTEHTLILSWAIPGQDGIGHVNCQHNIYIISEMSKRGMELFIDDTLEARQHVDNHTAYFRNSLLIFNKKQE